MLISNLELYPVTYVSNLVVWAIRIKTRRELLLYSNSQLHKLEQ